MDPLIQRLLQLRPNDREWLLDQLSLDEQSTVQAFIETSLGQPATDTVSENSSIDTSVNRALAAGEGLADADVIDQLSASEIAGLLAREPEASQALLLGIRKWQWADNFWFSLPTETAHRLKEKVQICRRIRARPALCEAILHLYASRARRRERGREPDDSAFARILDDPREANLPIGERAAT